MFRAFVNCPDCLTGLAHGTTVFVQLYVTNGHNYFFKFANCQRRNKNISAFANCGGLHGVSEV
jgi:hypothetical protein